MKDVVVAMVVVAVAVAVADGTKWVVGVAADVAVAVVGW